MLLESNIIIKDLARFSKNEELSSNITWLRFILASYVLFAHMCIWYQFVYKQVDYANFFILINNIIIKIFQSAGETNPAVLAFIVLSGYCIHRNGLRDWSFNVTKYFRRRFFRIYPVFFVSCLVGIWFFLFTNSEITQAITATKSISLRGVLVKILALHAFFPKMFNVAFQGNAPLLTVGVEMWLYVLYPLSLLVCNKIGNTRFVLLLLFQHLFWCVLLWMQPKYIPWWHNGSFCGFLIYWYLGAYFVDRGFVHKVQRCLQQCIFSFVLLSIIIICFTNNIFVVELRKLIFSFMIGLLIAKIDYQRESLKRTNINKKNMFFENIMASSYSLYALHAPILVLLINYNTNFFLAFLIVVLFGYISYQFIEQPFTQYSKRSTVIKLEDDLVY